MARVAEQLRCLPLFLLTMDLIGSWSDVEYWKRLCPCLSVSSGATAVNVHVDAAETEKRAQTDNQHIQQRLIEDGYALIDKQCNCALREKVANTISDLETKHSLPATFALLYDETWHLALQSQQELLTKNNILHSSMTFNFDMLAWHIDQSKNEVGFSPHRDRQPDTNAALKGSFYEDGQAKYVTHWIALTDANPNNSCLCEFI